MNVHMCKYVDQMAMISAGVTLEVILKNQLHAGNEPCKQGIPPDFETQSRCHPEVQNRVLVTPRCPLICFKKQKVVCAV